MSELKPCPFCGGKATIRSEHDSDGFGDFHYVGCSSCGSKSNYHFASAGNDCPQYYKEVRDSWNNRPHEAKIKAEAVREAAYKNRKAIVEGGDMWLCAVDDLVDHANRLEQGEK